MKSVILFMALVGCAFSLHFAVKNKAGQDAYCIILDANISGTVKYFDVEKNKTGDYDFVINNTSTTQIDEKGSSCNTVHNGKAAQQLSFTFRPNDITPYPTQSGAWNLTLYFAKKTDESKDQDFKIIDYSLDAFFYNDTFHTDVDSYTYTPAEGSEKEWSAEEAHGFSCSSAGLSFTNETTVQFKDMKVIAFAAEKSDVFPKEQTFEQCKLDIRTSDLVPIIVGACLAGLVVIVLIAYLIGRARAKRQGYASV